MLTVKDYIIERYSPYLQIKRREDRFRKDFGVLKIIMSYRLAEIKLNQVCKSDIEEFLFQIEKDRGASGATLNRYRARLHHIYSHANDNNLITINPVSRIKKRKEYPRTVSLTTE